MKNNSKKIIRSFLTIITFSFILNFSFISDSYSNICATAPAGTVYSGSGDDAGKNAEGALLVQDDGSGDITSFALASSPSTFNIGGSDNTCLITPDHYKITLYRLGLCTEDPFREPDDTHTNTIKADLSSCVTIYNNVSGNELDITPSGEIDLTDQPISIPVGTYKYPYIVVDNHIYLKHIQKFITAADNSPALVMGYHPTQDDKDDASVTGHVCYTGTDDDGNKFVDTLTWEKKAKNASPAYESLHGFDFPDEWPGIPPNTRYRCGTIDEAASGNDYAISIINSLNPNERIWQSASSIDLTNFRNATLCCSTNESIPGKQQFYNLLTTDNETIADSQINGRRILLVQIDENPIVVSEQTIGMKIRFKTNNAIDVRVFQRTEEDQVLAGTKMVAEAIWLDIQTKERRGRRGRVGDWR